MKLSSKLAALLASITFLLINLVVIINSLPLEFSDVLNACKYSILGAVVLGLVGYLIGEILVKSSYNVEHKYIETDLKSEENIDKRSKDDE